MPATKSGTAVIARGTPNAAFSQLTGCSVTRTGTTATLTKTAHGLSNGNNVLVQGFELEEFNGIFPATNVTANTFDYTIKQDPGANPAGTSGTVDKVTLGTALDASAAYGGYLYGALQNGNTGPTIAPQVWIGRASANNAVDYSWVPLLTGDSLANSLTPIARPIDAGMMWINIAICRNTGQPIDCYVLANLVTAG